MERLYIPKGPRNPNSQRGCRELAEGSWSFFQGGGVLFEWWSNSGFRDLGVLGFRDLGVRGLRVRGLGLRGLGV